MVAKGLKPGDTFVDGKRTYKVLSVYPNGNYVSKEVSKEELEEMKSKEEPAEHEPSAVPVEEEKKPEKKQARNTRTTKKTGK